MKAFISKEAWLDGMHGWYTTDCAVRDANIIYLVTRQDLPDEETAKMWEHDIFTRFVVIYLDDNPKGELGYQELEGFSYPRCGVSRQPIAQGLVASKNRNGDVLAMGSGHNGSIEHIAPGKVPATQRVKCIDDYAYSVGLGRSIYKRTNIGHWVKLDNGFPEEEVTRYQGFHDIDGFSETDMYAVGGHGDIWHYDGTIWMQEGFPSNMQLNTVTCAGDGYVYVSGMGGTLWRGRNSTWEHLYDGSYSIPWNDVLWFEDKLWLASDYMLRIWNGKEMVPVTDDKGQELPFSGHMDAYDGLLVIADTDTVMAYQNGKWRTLVAPYEDEE